MKLSCGQSPRGGREGGKYQVIRKANFSLKDATAFQSLTSNWDQEQGQDRQQKLTGCMSISLVGFQLLKNASLLCQLLFGIIFSLLLAKLIES